MKVTLTIATVKQDLAAPDQVLTDWQFIVSSQGAQVGRQDVALTTADFELAPGAYTATAQRFDSGGNAFGGSASVDFTVPAVPVEQGDAVGTLSVTLS